MVSTLSASPLQTPNSWFLGSIVVSFSSGMLMVKELDSHMRVMKLLSPQMELILFHMGGLRQLPQFETLILEKLLPNSRHLPLMWNITVFPLMADLWLVPLALLSMSGTSPTQTLALSRPLLDILITSPPSHFPLSLSHLATIQSSSGRLVLHWLT